MLTYCVKCRGKIENLNPNIFKTKNGRLIMQSKYTECRIKKSRFMEEQQAKRLLSNLGIKAPLSKIPLLNVLFLVYKMNEIVNKLLLTGDKLLVVHSQKTKKQLKNLCRREIKILFTKMILIKLVFDMI